MYEESLGRYLGLPWALTQYLDISRPEVSKQGDQLVHTGHQDANYVQRGPADYMNGHVVSYEKAMSLLACMY